MQDNMKPTPKNLTTPYTPVAVFYEGADLVEYVRADLPAVAKRVDSLLTLLVNMRDRNEVIGFRLKGFKNYYLRKLAGLDDFVTLVTILEQEITHIADEAFDRREAYKKARELAVAGNVVLKDLPHREPAFAAR
jgi:hypothetical protein